VRKTRASDTTARREEATAGSVWVDAVPIAPVLRKKRLFKRHLLAAGEPVALRRNRNVVDVDRKAVVLSATVLTIARRAVWATGDPVVVSKCLRDGDGPGA
jgi:hypothetical protein